MSNINVFRTEYWKCCHNKKWGSTVSLYIIQLHFYVMPMMKILLRFVFNIAPQRTLLSWLPSEKHSMHAVDNNYNGRLTQFSSFAPFSCADSNDLLYIAPTFILWTSQSCSLVENQNVRIRAFYEHLNNLNSTQHWIEHFEEVVQQNVYR